MAGTIGRRIAVVLTAVALGGVGVLVAQSPALAATFSAGYTCTSPVIGTESVTIDGTLAGTPNPATAGAAVTFNLHITQVSLRAPVTINSWTITTNLAVSGAETAQFSVTGSGGSVPANQPISGDLSGSWTPSAAGVDEIRGANVTVVANVFLLGNITINCTTTDVRPVGETLTVS